MAWRKEQSRDRFFREAKRQQYRARSAFKLLELNRRLRLVRPGDAVVDLGAAPGSWSQVLAELVGPGGRVVAADLEPDRAARRRRRPCRPTSATPRRADLLRARLGRAGRRGRLRRLAPDLRQPHRRPRPLDRAGRLLARAGASALPPGRQLRRQGLPGRGLRRLRRPGQAGLPAGQSRRARGDPPGEPRELRLRPRPALTASRALRIYSSFGLS